MRNAIIAAASLILVAFTGTQSIASPCGDKIAALEKKLNVSGGSTTASPSVVADARTVKTRKVLEDAKAADQRGDGKGCGATVDKAIRETGSAQQ